MKTLNFSARTAPSSAFGTVSPAEKRGGDGLSIITLSEIPQSPILIHIQH